MAKSWEIDPQKRDYVLDRGAPKQTDSLRIPAYMRLKTKRNTWMYAPDDQYGSEFHLKRKRRTSGDNSEVEDLAVSAVQPIVDDGRASEIEVQSVLRTRNNVGMKINITDAEGNVETLSFDSLGV
jgi:phage gp46-like protein